MASGKKPGPGFAVVPSGKASPLNRYPPLAATTTRATSRSVITYFFFSIPRRVSTSVWNLYSFQMSALS